MTPCAVGCSRACTVSRQQAHDWCFAMAEVYTKHPAVMSLPAIFCFDHLSRVILGVKSDESCKTVPELLHVLDCSRFANRLSLSRPLVGSLWGNAEEWPSFLPQHFYFRPGSVHSVAGHLQTRRLTPAHTHKAVTNILIESRTLMLPCLHRFV